MVLKARISTQKNLQADGFTGKLPQLFEVIHKTSTKLHCTAGKTQILNFLEMRLSIELAK